MQLTLREALTLAEPLRKARVVAGESGLDNVIRSVNVMEVPASSTGCIRESFSCQPCIRCVMKRPRLTP